MVSDDTERWDSPLISDKHHIFKNGVSLCDSYGFRKGSKKVTKDDTYDSEKHCKECCKKSDIMTIED